MHDELAVDIEWKMDHIEHVHDATHVSTCAAQPAELSLPSRVRLIRSIS